MTAAGGRPPRLDHERYCAEIVRQAALLDERAGGADRSAPVPTCPGWTSADLVRHVEDNLRALARAAGPVAGGGSPAETCAAALRAAGPDAAVELFGLTQPARDWARRAAHDLLIHRADAVSPARPDPEPEPDLAADALDELLTLTAGSVPAGLPAVRLAATDTGEEWLTAGTPPAVSVRAPLTDLLLIAYRRLPAAGVPGVEVEGDAAALAAWLEHASLD